MRKRFTIAAVCGVFAFAACSVAGPAQAATGLSAMPQKVLTGTETWQTCTPRAIGYRGMYRIGNDLFAGKRGPLCITSTGANFTTDTNVPAQPGGVVAAPYIRVGEWYGANDPTAPFPLPVLGRTAVVDTVTATGNAPGVWLADTDTYLYKHADGASGAPNYEIVIENRGSGATAITSHRLSISGRTWYASSWITCPGVIPCHRLIVFRLAHHTASIRERITTFVWHAYRLHWVPRGTWIGNTAYQLETWSGGKGMRLAMTVTFPVSRPSR